MRRKVKLPKLVLAVLGYLLSVGVLLPHFVLGAEQSDLNAVLSAKKIRVGMELVMKKRSFIDEATKKPAGMEVDIATEMAKRMGVELEIIDLPWDGLIPALVSGRIDVICTGMFRLEKRELSVSFSQPMWTFGQDLMVKKSDDRFTKLSDADKPDVKVAVTLGGAGEIAAKQYLPKAKVLTFPSGDQSGLALISGQADVWFDDDFYHVIYAEDHPDLKPVSGTSVMQTATGMAVRHGSDLLPWINLFLYNTKRDGMFNQLLKKWKLPDTMNARWDPTSYSQ